jgi:DNA-directed RNA polymerase sigma subunit (sigma70/sigma32)
MAPTVTDAESWLLDRIDGTKFTERQRSVLDRRLHGATFAEIAEDVGVTSYRIQQVQRMALRRMTRNAPLLEQLAKTVALVSRRHRARRSR